ncbi:MAG: hypothetical protein QNK20_13930 [Aureibaculum sp.]|nr:hypothetical protein [Aureibaculum sp.]
MKKITLFKYLLSAILLSAFLPNMFAQEQNANWYFGNQAGINFNDGTAPSTLLTNGAMNAPGGCSSVSDDFGGLLFYTNGVTVWNKNHVPMSNGNLMGDVNVSQSVAIIPNPANVDQYYIFSNSAENQANSGLRYSVVDMTLASGLGDVDSNTQDVVLLTNCSEKMTAIINPWDNTYWLVSFGPSSDPAVYDTFYAFKIDENGDVNAPIVSDFSSDAVITIPYQTTEFAYAPYAGGQMKISPDFNTLALVHNLDDRGGSAEALFIFDFSPITGLLASNSIRSYYLNDLFTQSNTYYYGLEFSPDSQQIFVSTFEKDGNGFGEVIRMRNFAQGETPNYFLMGVPDDRDSVFGLQLGIDNKIYATRGDFSFLDVITNPDEQGEMEINYSFGGYIGEGFDLGSKIAGQGLPQLSPEIFNSTVVTKKAAKPIVKENPFRNELKLKFKYIQTYNIEYHDSMGVLIKTEDYEMTNRRIHKVDTQAWGDGMYYVKIIGAETGDVFYNTAIKAQ